jgi:4-oxalomesaconate hydratase
MSNLLVVVAHAADYCTRAGGTIARYAAAGWNARIVAITDGARGESGGYWRKEPNGTVEACAAARREESSSAAERLGAKIDFYGLLDYPLLESEETTRRLTRTILDFRPAIIITHWLNDPLNADHEVTARSVVRAIGSAAQLGAFPDTPAHWFPDLYMMESTVPYSEFNRFEPDTYIDIDSVFETKMEAVALFASQPQLVGYYTHFATHRGFQATEWAKRSIRYAEAFRRYLPFVGEWFPTTAR